MNKKELLSLSKADVLPVDIGGSTVHVRSLSLADVSDAEKRIKDGANALAVWTILSACDPSGNRLFTFDDVATVEALPAKLTKQICEAAIEHNGLGNDGTEDPNP